MSRLHCLEGHPTSLTKQNVDLIAALSGKHHIPRDCAGRLVQLATTVDKAPVNLGPCTYSPYSNRLTSPTALIISRVCLHHL